ncbi:MAG TPA: hypothetical protein VFP46_01325 [Candidatus Paceibacterota bacterium]|nr:hypothetical protein [Candidatus Paceibacterota bacterium]
MPTERPTEIAGWEGRLPELAAAIHRLPFAQLKLFYEGAERELGRQADSSRADGDMRTAREIEHAAYLTHLVQRLLSDFAFLK